eukprot:CAMPEP_0118937432 /NCGR_PEP_ID=MMETSP1169-20130426/22734_1 /TAXON_ID=36882 /ORGANISM="Pyramimonas obovata, Strain CCMP722" /LENGTH=56 /DNA_ID=CAMNT_0006881059 /DNA_START=29 /DNA_END=196 /DNA_ORIENTATION=-
MDNPRGDPGTLNNLEPGGNGPPHPNQGDQSVEIAQAVSSSRAQPTRPMSSVHVRGV